MCVCVCVCVHVCVCVLLRNVWSSVALVMRETGGDGVGRLVEATGATNMVNGSFSLLRYIAIHHQ